MRSGTDASRQKQQPADCPTGSRLVAVGAVRSSHQESERTRRLTGSLRTRREMGNSDRSGAELMSVCGGWVVPFPPRRTSQHRRPVCLGVRSSEFADAFREQLQLPYVGDTVFELSFDGSDHTSV